MTTTPRRWDNDPHGQGMADGHWIRPSVARLEAALAAPAWIAEAPDAHLLPYLQHACAAAGSPWRLLGRELGPDADYVVTLEWTQPAPRLRQLRADVYALLGQVAEGVTFVRQQMGATTIEYHVVTGQLDDDTPFAGHGHLLRLCISGPAVTSLCTAASGSR